MGITGLRPKLRPITSQLSFRRAALHVRHELRLPADQPLKVVVDGCCWIHAAAERYGKEMLAGDFSG